MSERLTDSPVKERETVLMRAVCLAYRLGRQDQQRILEYGLRRHYGAGRVLDVARDIASVNQGSLVSFNSIIRAAEFDSTAFNDSEEA